MIEPRWITNAGLLILHEDSIREHGGSRGLRDEGLLESALARPRNLALYKEHVSLAKLVPVHFKEYGQRRKLCGGLSPSKHA